MFLTLIRFIYGLGRLDTCNRDWDRGTRWSNALSNTLWCRSGKGYGNIKSNKVGTKVRMTIPIYEVIFTVNCYKWWISSVIHAISLPHPLFGIIVWCESHTSCPINKWHMDMVRVQLMGMSQSFEVISLMLQCYNWSTLRSSFKNIDTLKDYILPNLFTFTVFTSNFCWFKQKDINSVSEICKRHNFLYIKYFLFYFWIILIYLILFKFCL